MSGFYESVKEQSVALYETIVEGISDFKTFVAEAWPLLILLFAILVAALWISDPIPPRTVSLAAGYKGSANDILAREYKNYFKNKGIDLQIVNTNGSVDNLALLKDKNSPVKAAFVMTGTPDRGTKGVYTLGSVGYEPLWCFYRGDIDFISKNPKGIKNISEKKINIGPLGSGTNHLISRILPLFKVNPDSSNFKHLVTEEAISKLKVGELDAMCIADSEDNPYIPELLDMENIHLSDMVKSEAIARKVSSIEMVTVPQGSLDLSKGVPKDNVNLIAATREILVDETLHPAIQTLFLMAAHHINGGEGFFAKEGEFPVFKDNIVKRSPEAETYYSKGDPYMVSWLPFWLSEFARRLFLTLLPLVAIAYPIIKSTPNYYKNRVRGRINKLYGEIKFFEQQLVANFDKNLEEEYLKKLKEIEINALKIKVPKSISQDYYTMRSSIDFITSRIVSGFYEKEAEINIENTLKTSSLDNSNSLTTYNNQDIQ